MEKLRKKKFMISKYLIYSVKRQYFVSILSIIVVSVISYFISDFIGYRSVALLLLATVSLLAVYCSTYPVLIAATLSAVIWDFFFIPPFYTLHVDNTEDFLMLILYFIIAFTNGALTSKIRQYEKLENQRKERNNALKLYKTLFNSISHELRTPISTIVAASDNLMNKTVKISDENRMKLAEEISIASFRLNRLVDNLLNMQRLESGFIKPKLDWFDVNELINSVINRLEVELSNHNLEIKIDENVPFVKLDFGLIEQAISNIVYNATLYTPINTNIEIDVKYENSFLIISISDNGKGFNSDEIDKIFTNFYRSPLSKAEGTGLGLSIVKGFIEAHCGTIKVENRKPCGAKFTISLPSDALNYDETIGLSETKN